MSDKPALKRTVSENHGSVLSSDKKYGISKHKEHHLDGVEAFNLAQSHILLKGVDKMNFRGLFGLKKSHKH